MFKPVCFSVAFVYLALILHAIAVPMSDNSMRRINFNDENVSRYMEGSSNQAAPFDREAWNALLRETDAEQG